MSHRIHNTLGLVLRRLEVKEDSQIYYFFTNKFGLILVSARGIRKMSSKLRPFLQEGMINSFDLVFGRNGYILTGARPVFDNLGFAIDNSYIFETVSNYLLENEKDHPRPELFQDLMTIFSIYKDSILKEKGIELVDFMIYRELIRLGYIPVNKSLLNQDFLEGFKKYQTDIENGELGKMIKSYRHQGLKNLSI